MDNIVIIAKLEALRTDNTDEMQVIVEEHIAENMESTFRVYVNGGVLGNGDDEFVCNHLPTALARATHEVACCLQGL